eukprot:13448166-Alexandrium_andersonii.AAC.1
MCGAKPGAGPRDVTYPLQAAIESTRHVGGELCGIMLDREKCFDRLTFELFEPLQRAHGCPKCVLKPRVAFYGSLQRRTKLGSTYGESIRPTNALLQGCVWSIDDINQLMG